MGTTALRERAGITVLALGAFIVGWFGGAWLATSTNHVACEHVPVGTVVIR